MIANSSQGIVEMIQRKKDAYQDNPQALQQRYQQNKQLTDLLALQQLKTEKEAAARDIQLKMQQNPQTIAQQREQEVLGLIKQEQGRNLGEVTQQVGGVLGQRQKEAMQRRQRMGMAQGGIVGFDEGGLPEEARRRLRESRGAAADFEYPESALSKFRRYVEKFEGPEYERGTPEYKERLRRLGEKKKQKEAAAKLTGAKDTLDDRLASYEGKRPRGLLPKPMADSSALARQGARVKQNIEDFEAQQTPADEGQGILNKLTLGVPDVEVGTARQDDAKGILDDLGQTARVGRDFGAVRQARMADVKDEMGLAGIQTKKQSQIDRLRDQQQRLSERDPFEAFIAGTVGAAQRGGPGGFAAGYIGKLSQQRAQQRQNLKDEFGIENELLNIEQTVLAKGIDSADEAVRVLSEEKRAYADTMARASDGDRADAQQQANRILDANVQNVRTELELLGQQTDAAIEAAKARGASLKDMQDLLATEIERRDKVVAPIVTMLVNEIEMGGDVEAALNKAGLTKGYVLDQLGVFDREEDLLREIAALGGDVSSQRARLAGRKEQYDTVAKYLQDSEAQ